MEEKEILRINELAKKQRTAEGLNENEKREQAELRLEYRKSVTGSLCSNLDNMTIIYEDGTTKKVAPK